MDQKAYAIAPEDFCAHLGLSQKDFYAFFAQNWEEFLEKCDTKKPFFAEKSFYEKWHTEYVSASPEILKRMGEVEKILEQDPVAALYADILHYGIFVREQPCPMGKLPELKKTFGENSGILQLLVAESHLPAIQKAYGEMGLPPEYLRGVGKWIDGTIKIYAAAHDGIPGHTLEQTAWIRSYGKKLLFRIGRFEFLLHTYPQWLPCLYVNDEGTVLAFHKDGSFVRKDGRRSYKETENCRKMTLKEEADFVTGCPILPDGSSDPDCLVRLPLSRWKALCTPWDIVPSVHIPGGERMAREEVDSSFTKANEFFRTCFGSVPKLYGCYSWILNPDWQEYLPDSNMVHFQDQGYKFPAWGGMEQGGQDGVFFVFGKTGKADVANLPCANRMEEIMVKAFREKGCLRSGGLFILSRDADKVGEKFYLKNLSLQKKIVEENRI